VDITDFEQRIGSLVAFGVVVDDLLKMTERRSPSQYRAFAASAACG
jgi:hypothetical protein